MTDNTPKYELLGYSDNGDEIRLYNDGSKRNQLGRIIEFPIDVYNNPVITSDNAHEYHKMRKDKILRAIEKSVMDVTRTNVPSDAIGAIVGKRAEIAMKDDTRIGNEAAKIVLSAIDAYQDKQSVSTNVLRNEYAMDDSTRELLERLMQSRQADDSDIVDGKSIE